MNNKIRNIRNRQKKKISLFRLMNYVMSILQFFKIQMVQKQPMFLKLK